MTRIRRIQSAIGPLDLLALVLVNVAFVAWFDSAAAFATCVLSVASAVAWARSRARAELDTVRAQAERERFSLQRELDRRRGVRAKRREQTREVN